MKIKFAYTICFSSEKKNAFFFLKQLEIYIDKKTDKIFCITDKNTSKITTVYLKKFCKVKKNFKIINFNNTKNFSETKIEALKFVKNYDYIFDMDGNFAHNPSSIKIFKKKIFKNNFDAVCGSRFMKNGRYIHDSNYQRFFLSYFGTKLVNFILNTRFVDATGGYLCLSSKVVKSILDHKIYSRAHFYHVELKNIISSFKFCEIPITYKKSNTKIKNKTIFIALFNLIRLFINNNFKNN